MGCDLKSFIKVAEGFYVQGLIDSLNDNPQLWDENPQRRNYENSPHAEMTDIWVRFGKGDFAQLNKPHDSEWYDSADLLPDAKAIALHLMGMVDGERLGGVLITRLPAGGKISPHIDKGWHAGYYEKFYIALTAPEGSVFGFEDGDIVSQPGDCYLFRNDRLHWVNNPSNETRLTMIVCIKTDMFKGE